MPCVACTYMPNASWRRRGVASARGGGSPTLETERSGSGKGEGLHKRSAEAWGNPLRARGAELPLAAFAVAFALQKIRAGVAGRNRPAEVGGGGPRGPQTGRKHPPSKLRVRLRVSKT